MREPLPTYHFCCHQGSSAYDYQRAWVSKIALPITAILNVFQCSSRPSLYALTIGINKYAINKNNLLGCVNDADSVEEFLKNNLKVPDEQIISLRDEKATRAAIIKAFLQLRDDPRIKKDDSILIFYAGHGSEVAPPDGWEAGGAGSQIQALVPHDYNTSDPRNSIHLIPDRTIGALINSISREKGNNIVSENRDFIWA